MASANRCKSMLSPSQCDLLYLLDMFIARNSLSSKSTEPKLSTGLCLGNPAKQSKAKQVPTNAIRYSDTTLGVCHRTCMHLLPQNWIYGSLLVDGMPHQIESPKACQQARARLRESSRTLHRFPLCFNFRSLSMRGPWQSDGAETCIVDGHGWSRVHRNHVHLDQPMSILLRCSLLHSDVTYVEFSYEDEIQRP